MKIKLLIFFLCISFSLIGQNTTFRLNDFFLLGDAMPFEDAGIRLTDNLHNQKGAMWYKDAIDLNSPFLLEFKVFFGCSNGGADGLVFVLHPQIALGDHDYGIGFKGLSPSFGVEMDTYQDFNRGDPHYDHAAFIANGNISHHLALTESVPLYPWKKSVENCKWHYITFKWDSKSQIFSFYVDSEHRLSRKIDLTNVIFGGSSRVFWGFTSATGMHRNPHIVAVNLMRFDSDPLLSKEDERALASGDAYELDQLDLKVDPEKVLLQIGPELERLIQLHAKYPEHTLIIDLFQKGADTYEESQNKAEFIGKYLIERGVPEHLVRFYGNGSADKDKLVVRMKMIRA